MNVAPIHFEDLQASKTPFISYLGRHHPKNQQSFHEHAFVAINLDFAPVKALRQEIEAKLGCKLRGYPEAHITVITPPEFSQHFPADQIEEIQNAALVRGIQKLPFQIKGLGLGTQARLQTFFLVVQSPEICAFRKQLFADFSHRKVDPGSPYFPHITVGFTERDLYLEDGVQKDERSLVQRWS